ncbi:MAG: GGDEF domain-containing protein [Chitinivibrionales bacterium]|nr:GGDEF domain-containing protein [Chitinivibrionales bacterium]
MKDIALLTSMNWRCAMCQNAPVHDVWAEIESLRRKAVEYKYKDGARSVGLLQKAMDLVLAQTSTDPRWYRTRTMVHMDLGSTYVHLDKYDLAMEHCSTAREMFTVIDEKLLIGRALLNMSAVHGLIGDHPGCIELVLNALDIFKAMGDREYTSLCLNNLGYAYIMLNEFDKGIAHLKGSVQLSDGVQNRVAVAHSYQSLCEAYICIGKYEESLQHARKSLKYFSLEGDRKNIAVTLSLMGKAYSGLRAHATSLRHLRNALNLADSETAETIKVGILIRMGEICISDRRTGNARCFLHQALSLLETLHENRLLADCYHHLSAAYEQDGDYSRSVEYFKKFISLHDTVIDELARQRLRTLDIVHHKDGEIAARYGGEEFIMLLPKKNLDDAKIVAERIRCEIERHKFIFSGQAWSVTLSFGVAEMDCSNDATIQELIHVADQRLYSAKNRGKNRIH